MFGPMHPAAILNYAQILTRAVRGLEGYPAIVERMNTLEESLPTRDQEREPEREPETEPGGGPRVSALRRRWLFLRDAACEEAARALYGCAKAVRFAPRLGHRLARLADRTEKLCPMDLVGPCDVCEARELISRMVFSGERAVCEGCVRATLTRANALRFLGEPVMTETFLCELLSLHRVPHWKLEGDSTDAAMARDAKDAEIRHERLMSIGDFGDDTRDRWFLAIAPIAHRLGTFDQFMSASRGRASEEG